MKNKKLIGLLALLMVAASARAEGTAIDTAITALTGSGTQIAAVAGTLAAICASVMIWGKVRKYFSKAG